MSVQIVGPSGVFRIDCTVGEQHVRSSTITEVPVEDGATLSDHAVVKPASLTLEIGQDAPADAWKALERLQRDRQGLTVVTGLDVYRNMLVKDVSAPRDVTTQRILRASVQLQEVRIAESARVAVRTAPGGAGSSRAEPSRAGGAVPVAPSRAAEGRPKARSASTVHRGDTVTETVPTEGTSPEAERSRSILKRITG